MMKRISEKTKIRWAKEKELKKARCKLIGALWLQNEYGQEYVSGYCEECEMWTKVLQLSHTKHKGMGGTTHEYTVDEVRLLCNSCHARKEHGIKVVD